MKVSFILRGALVARGETRWIRHWGCKLLFEDVSCLIRAPLGDSAPYKILAIILKPLKHLHQTCILYINLHHQKIINFVKNWKQLKLIFPKQFNPITGGGGGRIAPRLVFLLSTENGLRWRLETSWLFLHIHWECCTKCLSFYFAQRRLQYHFLGGMFANFRPFFNFRKLWNLILCDGLIYWETCPEIWPKSFKKQRSYNNFKHLVKKRRKLFLAPWTPNSRFYFRKRIL